MLKHIAALALLELFVTPAPAEEIKPFVHKTTIELKTNKPADQATIKIENDTATLDIHSQTGIGGATVALTSGAWPTTVVLRFHFGGLESFAVSNGTANFGGSVLSHSGYHRLLSVTENGSEKRVEKGSPYFTDIRAFNAIGKQADGLPGQGGYFEMALPKVLLIGGPKRLELRWIDFFRE